MSRLISTFIKIVDMLRILSYDHCDTGHPILASIGAILSVWANTSPTDAYSH